MLKIKDEVDLKELEKFGFINRGIEFVHCGNGFNFIKINTFNREITWFDNNEILFDLIQAGYVEKAEEV